MSVDTSIYIGVGRVVPTKDLERDIPNFDDEPNDASYNFFKENYPLLELIDVGNYLSGDIEYMLAVRSLTDSYDTMDIPGGVLEAPDRPSAEELNQFRDAYESFTGNVENPKSFVAVLWF